MKIMCISCRYAQVDESASEKNWKAYECTNADSEYYKALLNVTPHGNKNRRISWSGCDKGSKKVKAV